MCLAPGRGICRQACRRGTENTSLKQKQRLVLETLSMDLNSESNKSQHTHARTRKNSKKEKLASTNLLWRKWRLTSAGVSIQLQTNSVRALPQKLNHLNTVNSKEELDISKLLHFCDLPILGIKVKFLIIFTLVSIIPRNSGTGRHDRLLLAKGHFDSTHHQHYH